MGGTCSNSRVTSKDIQVPHLKQRNAYGSSQQVPDEQVLHSVFPVTFDYNRQSKVITIIQNSSQTLFEDYKFELKPEQSLRLSVSFNFLANRTKIFTAKQPTDPTSLLQLNLEFCYLTSVFYLFCKRQAKSRLLPRLVQAQQTNRYGAYCVHLFCNGEAHQVLIDDRIPTHHDNYLYLRIVKGNELWPLILQKVWCKQIGSYESAQGLSPEDAFQEITGAPAYTYTIEATSHPYIENLMRTSLEKGYWVALIARSGLSRQVFHLSSAAGDRYTVITPYVKHTFEENPLTKQATLGKEELFQRFEHIVVGYYKPTHTPVSISVTCKPRQQLIFQIFVRNRQEVSIRLNQFYQGYLDPAYRVNYQYSPVMMQLYEVNEASGSKTSFILLKNCQGCPRSLSGSRSTQCAANIMQPLQGKYLLRLQIGWQYPQLLSSGNLVAYASQGNLQISQLKNTDIMIKEVYPSLFRDKRQSNLIILHEHNLEVRTFDKENSTLIMFHNVTESTQHFQADFSRSKNIRLRGKEVDQRQVFIRLQAEENEIVEVLADNLKQHIEIHNFQINKIPIKS